MKNIVLLFSHTLTESQKKDLKMSLNIKKIYSLGQDLQNLWSQVPIDKNLDFNIYFDGTKKFLFKTLSKEDFVLIQGDFGATYYMIEFCKKEGLIPIYSVNKRVSKESIKDGIIKKYSEFEHKCFRVYKS